MGGVGPETHPEVGTVLDGHRPLRARSHDSLTARVLPENLARPPKPGDLRDFDRQCGPDLRAGQDTGMPWGTTGEIPDTPRMVQKLRQPISVVVVVDVER